MACNAIHGALIHLLTPLHPLIPFAPLDIYGAIRLSQIVDWTATGAFELQDGAAHGKTDVGRKRASLGQECLGLLVVLSGGETFLATCTGTLPSWLVSPKTGLLFVLTHAVQTRTSLRQYMPPRPTLGLELLLAIPDAVGRTLFLTRFSVLPMLSVSPGSVGTGLPATPATLLLVPLILAAPFAALAFTGLNLFSARATLSTPIELRPGGWLMVDAWLPVLLPALFCSLIGPVQGWSMGLGWSEEEAVTACLGVVVAAFAGRAVYNYGFRAEQS